MRCVRRMWRMAGDRCLMRILVTAPLSSHIHSCELRGMTGVTAGKFVGYMRSAMVHSWSIGGSCDPVAVDVVRELLRDNGSGKMCCIMSKRPSNGNPSILREYSRAIISASVEECDTKPCFLHIPVNATNALGPTREMKVPVVERLFCKSPARSESVERTNLH